MKNRVSQIWYKSKKIYLTDWTNLKTPDVAFQAIEESTSYIEKLNEFNLLEIIDVTGSFASPQVLGALKESGKRTKKFSKRKAIVGVTGSKRIILAGVNRFIDGNINGFNTIEEAKEWVVSE